MQELWFDSWAGKTLCAAEGLLEIREAAAVRNPRSTTRD